MIELYGGYIRYVRQWIVFVSQISLLLVSLFHLLKKKKQRLSAGLETIPSNYIIKDEIHN